MARTKFKWKFAFFFYLVLVNVCTRSLPIPTGLSLTVTDTAFRQDEFPDIDQAVRELRNRAAAIVKHEELAVSTVIENSTEIAEVNSTEILHTTKNTLLRNVRPGQEIRQYAIELTANGGNTFSGRAVIDVVLSMSTREDPIELHVENLDIQSVLAGVFTDANAVPTDFDVDDGILSVEPNIVASSYILIIEYTGQLQTAGQGFYRGSYNDFNYLAMNLHPTHARRVFPCMDEPTEASIISFTFNGMEYNHLMTNSQPEDNNTPNQFRALQGPPHLWSMAAHNLNNILLPTSGVLLYVRPGVTNQESQASVALNFYYHRLVSWTNKPYFEILWNQAEQLSILSLPDVNRDWHGLSIVALWEPYILMENSCSVKQRFTALLKMAEAMARQWFGHVVYPENWRYEWVVSGLASYAAYDILREFQTDPNNLDISLIDVNTLFVTEVIQESLYRDAYATAHPLELSEDIFDEDAIRDYIYGDHKFKAPALFRMLRLILGDEEQDFIQQAGRALIAGRALQTVNSANLVDAINSNWTHHGTDRIDDVGDYIEPWIENTGYPLITVNLLPNGVLVTQERFGFSNVPHIFYEIPITYSMSTNPDFENIYPIEMMEGTMSFPMFLDEEEGDYVLFNVQGQGYYRVNYDERLWERIIEALEDPDRREEIHPLNRATLIDDALNLARSGRLSYETAFMVVLTMEHEIEYAPWKAFIRNMNFLRKRLVALVDDDEDLDPDIYLRMVRRSIIAFEREITFDPDPLVTETAMTSLTRGLVMDHACRSGYQPCIAAAVDWFYDPNSNDEVNPNIPNDIRPAVYCTMVREGGEDVINALNARLEIEVSMWERVVILESLTCSTDQVYVRNLLELTISGNNPYTTEERVKIFIAAAESSYQNARVCLNFLSDRVGEIRDMYGGASKLEEIINALGENMADFDLSNDFVVWVNSRNSGLDDSELAAERVAERVLEDQQWNDANMDFVYEWIDDNDAPTLVVSLLLITISCIIGLLNH